MGSLFSSLTKILGKVDPFSGLINSALGLDGPKSTAATAEPPPAVSTAPIAPPPAAATIVGQGRRTTSPDNSGIASPRVRTARGARSGSILTTNLDDAKLGG